MINAKKDKNIDDSCLKKIKEHARTIDNLHDSLLNWRYETHDERKKIYDLNNIYYNLRDAEKKKVY